MPLTISECRLQGYTVTAWCERCRRGVALDLLPFALRERDLELPDLFLKLRCDRCSRPASSLTVSRMKVGKSETVLELAR
jgi:hypothetical protein